MIDVLFFFFKQKTAYEMRISDWSSDVCSSDLLHSIDTSTTTIVAVALMFLPGIGIMTWKEAQPKIPWGTIVLFGIGISLGTALLQTKGAGWLAQILVAQLGTAQAPASFTQLALGLFLIVLPLGFASVPALPPAP